MVVMEDIEVRVLEDPDGSVATGIVAPLHQASGNYPGLAATHEDFAIPHRRPRP
jgi:hypothetical protein